MQAAEAIVAERQAADPSATCSNSANGSIPGWSTAPRSNRWLRPGAFDFTAPAVRKTWPRSSGPCSPARSALADRRSGQKGLFEDDAEEAGGRRGQPARRPGMGRSASG